MQLDKPPIEDPITTPLRWTWIRFFTNLYETLRAVFPFKAPNNYVWDDLRFPASRGQINPVTSKPDFDSSNVGLLLDPSTEEPIYFVAQLPHAYKHGSNVRPHVHWAATTTNVFPVSFKLSYQWSNTGQVPPAFTTSYTTVTPSGTAYKTQYSNLGNIVNATAIGSSIIKFILTRDATNATTDTYPSDIRLDEFDIHYQIDKIGSTNESPA